MAARTIAATDTIEDLRITFNALSEDDFGDIANLDGSLSATNVIGAVNEIFGIVSAAAGFTITDGSTSQVIGNGETLTINGTSNEIEATVSATDTLTIGLPSAVTISTSATVNTMSISTGSITDTTGTIDFGNENLSTTGNITTTTVNSSTIPSSQTLVGRTTTDTLTNKTLTQPTITQPSISAPTITSDMTLGASVSLKFEGATDDAFETSITVADPTSDRTITFPNATGTVSLLTNTETLTNKTINSSNNTITISGSEATISDIGNSSLTNSSITINGTSVSLGSSINVGDITGVTAGDGLTGGGTSGAVTLNIQGGTGIDVFSNNISVDVSDFMTNGSNNRVLTATGTDGMNAESSVLIGSPGGSDFRVLGTSEDYLLYTDYSLDRVRVGTSQAIDSTTNEIFSVYHTYTGGFAAAFANGPSNSNRKGLYIKAGDTSSGTLVTFANGGGTSLGSITFSGGTITYGAFTAHHPIMLPEGVTEYEFGTLLEIVSVYEVDGVIKYYNVQKTTTANSKAVLGAYAGPLLSNEEEYPNLHHAFVLGDGHILCNNSGGNISIGDGICSSSVSGIGQKATFSPSMIMGIAQKNITFSDDTEIIAVPVQYGLQQFTPWAD